jgi:hypothetical protein
MFMRPHPGRARRCVGARPPAARLESNVLHATVRGCEHCVKFPCGGTSPRSTPGCNQRDGGSAPAPWLAGRYRTGPRWRWS